MPAGRLFLGRLPYRATERDVEQLLRKVGKVSDIMLKTGYGFVEMADARDADDAVHELDGKDFMGMRITVEHARGTPHGRDCFRDSTGAYEGDRERGGGGGGGGGRGGSRDRSDRERRGSGGHRVIVENLSSRVTRQELKDFFRKVGDVTYAEAGKRKNEGAVEFGNKADARGAIKELDGKELKGRRLRLCEEKKRSRSRSRSGSKNRSRSRSGGRSVSRTPPPKRPRRESEQNGAEKREYDD